TMVIDAYGHSYRIADILRVEVRLHEITVADGLLHSSGIDRTVARFGFRATWLQPGSLDQVIATANSGKPVIANLRGPNFPTGHCPLTANRRTTGFRRPFGRPLRTHPPRLARSLHPPRATTPRLRHNQLASAAIYWPLLWLSSPWLAEEPG